MPAYPKIFRLRQNFERPRVENVPAEVERQLAGLRVSQKVGPGQSVAIAVGSRGIAKINEIVRGVVQHFLRLGAAPFIVPAMGSHGGGTAEGQRRILESYSVTEALCGCPIRASMETVVVDRMAESFPIHFDRLASEADHVFICARVKSHTSFVGRIESGLTKMLLVGLGKHDGAKVFHRAIHDYSFEEIVRGVGRRVLERCRILGGMAIVENAYNEVARLSAVGPDEFEEADESLLKLAKKWLPRLPFDFAHVLLIDEIGKNISGAGMDTNVVGRKFRDGQQAFNETPKIRRIIVRGLSKATHGIAHGVGIADFCKTRVVR
ncbi:MAG TPA: [Fe-S]-binding protein [Pirellulales bacterium]